MRTRIALMTASLTATLLASTTPSHATEYAKETVLSWVGAQAARPIQTATQNSVFVSFPSGAAPWSVNGGSGGPACSEAAAILPTDAYVRAVALTAIASGASVQVAVDNTLPMIGSYCTVTMLSIESN